MVPGLWLNEGGQSAAGAAIEQLVQYHPAAASTRELAKSEGLSLVGWLAREAERRGGAAHLPQLVGTIHVVPEFLGNRAPFADPDARALIAGLGMDSGVDTLVGLYLAGLAGLGYGLRQILAAQAGQGIAIDTIVVSGGAAQSPMVRQILADTTGVAVAATDAEEPVLVGAAILGALAFGNFANANAAMSAMSVLSQTYEPTDAARTWHDARSAAYETLQNAARGVRDIR
jgi:D-ribulokinase